MPQWGSNKCYFSEMSAIVLLILLSKGIAETNVALNKPAKYCNSDNKIDLVTDGDKNYENSAIFVEPCSPDTYFKVDLEALYYVHYVVVTEGEAKDELEKSLDNFVVELCNDTGICEICSMFPRSSLGEGKDMRVNCWSRFASVVRIRSLINLGLSVAEIEVYTLAEGPEEVTTFHYGCFDDFVSKASHPFTDWKTCLLKCQNFQFAAIINESNCECGYPSQNVQIEQEHCNIICGNKYCGGGIYYSVYLVKIILPFYLGCFKKARRSPSGINVPGVTPEFCINHCMHFQNTSTALLERGQYCTCFDYTSYKSDPNYVKTWEYSHETCLQKCQTTSDLCGGHDSVSSYALTNFALHEVGALQFYNCKNKMDRYGVCDGCKPGFEGSKYCIGKMINVKPNCEEYDHCAYMVDRICDDSKGIYECQCLPGYFENKESNLCEDIDECKSGKELCRETTSSCVNMNGSFQCSCNPGFWQTSWFLCTEGEKPEPFKLKVLLAALFISLLIVLSFVGMYKCVYKNVRLALNESQDSKSDDGGGSIGGDTATKVARDRK